MKVIYLIRHGQTEYNKLKLVQGSGIDSNLNEVGWAQSEAFHAEYANVPFDKVYTSELKRTHQTVRKFTEEGIPWEQFEGLNEISWGKKEGKIITPEDDKQHYEMLAAWQNGNWNWKIEGGESPLEVQKRQRRDWNKIMLNTDEKHILVCMHGRAMRILLCMLLGVSLSEMDRFSHGNTCLYKVSYLEGQYKLELENDTSHLSELLIAKKSCHTV